MDPDLRALVLRRDADRCQGCGLDDRDPLGIHLEIDHIVPRSQHGATRLDNLRALCRGCNRAKSDQMLWVSPLAIQRIRERVFEAIITKR